MQRIVVIGGVAAGLKAAAKVRRLDAEAQITVLERGELVSYGACGLPYFIGGEVEQVRQLMSSPSGTLRTPEFFKKAKNLDVLTRMEAVAIKREAKIVHALNLETGAKQQFAYDKLVLATGASPLKPAWPGVEKENIFHVWRPQDAAAIRRGLETQKYEKAVVIGAGLIGLEIAEALRMWDVDVTVVEMKNQLFPALLDEDMAQELELSLAAKGLQFLKEEAVEAFGGDAQVREVKTDKRTLTADLVILALGARPNVELARQAGLEIGTSGAIAVNEYLQTSDKAIFAGGDCAENTHRVSGEKVFLPMGSTANKHGRVIGENLCGAGVKFGGVLGTAVVKLFEMQVGRTGLNERQGAAAGFECVSVTVAGYDRPHYMKAARKVLLKLTADAVSRQLLGMQAWGEGDVVKRVDVAAMALSLGATVDNLFDADLAYSPPFNSPIDMLAVAANKLTAKLGRC
ncbi:MAG: FAD-dependent oxidoreductase [Anaeromusa sp.]|uniref:FAD-dependent oxidoreductase n=1 Tax=Anaeromusa sp. TaxID=1872520 RepID=UPI002B214F6F|nr:FAD-dependent oxidoreductase [Anaeromusa sp.]MEA4835103.1 FAD-dependent oxidoreductase [Anaeromusa sp.]